MIIAAIERMAALAIFTLLLPTVLVFALLIRRVSAGPAFIGLEREGIAGRPFVMTKLRTMVHDAEAELTRILSDDGASEEWRRFGRLQRDPRIAGGAARIARRFSIDEIPQFLDVARGRMALVGPRPLPHETARLLPARVRLARGAVRPGITGLWQVEGRANVSLKRMAALDLLYIKRRGWRLNLLILVRTLFAVVSGRGAF